MTTTSQVRPGQDADDATDGPAAGAPRPRGLLLAALAAVVALVCAALLPFLPVVVERPVVTWPLDPAAPASTALQLTTQRPLALDVAFDCRAARLAAAAPDGLVLGTVPPIAPTAGAVGLLAVARGDRLTVASRGTGLVDRPLPPGDCRVAVHGDLTGLTATVDGVVVGRAPGRDLPDIDALVTSVAVPAGAPAPLLSARVEVDDQASSSPTGGKTAVTVLLVLAVLGVLVGLALADRERRAAEGPPDLPPATGDDEGDGAAVPPGSATARARTARARTARAGTALPGDAAPTDRPPRWRPTLPAVVDLVVPAVMVLWLFLAPMTDDDGYYAAMAANVPAGGYVANYFQLYNQSFTPFTWIYYALSWWQGVAGTSPVVLRVPALAAGLATWFLARLYVARALPAAPGSTPGRGAGIAVRLALAVAFLAWWLPYDMGVRPEAVVAATTIASMLGLAVAVERGRWSLAAAAVAVGAFGVVAAPTGFVALAPLLAGAPAVWRMLRRTAPSRGRALLGLLAVVAPGALTSFLAFADGAWRDFLRAQQIFLGMQSQETWYSEIQRWTYLLGADDPMGNYAKRAPVLFGLLAVGVFVALVATARARGRALPARMELAGWTTIAGFLLLWLTPSKWTHHFGTLAAAGPVLLALVLVGAPLLVRDVADDRKVSAPVVATAALGVAAAAALAGHGTNNWPYSWLLGIPDPKSPPQVAGLAFDQPLWWLLLAALVGVATVVVVRRRAPGWRPVAGVVAVSLTAALALLASTSFLVGDFAVAAARTSTTWSPWADALRDPLGTSCAAQSQVEALDPASARALPAAEPPAPAPPPEAVAAPTGGGAAPPAATFVAGGWFPSSPPPLPAGVPTVGSFHGSAANPDANAPVGGYTGPWSVLPAPAAGRAVSVYLSGRTGAGNRVRAEYGRATPTGIEPVGDRVLGETATGSPVDGLTWRSVALTGAAGPPAGADRVRLLAEDTSTAQGGWTALTAPVLQRWTSLGGFVPSSDAVAVGWPIAFLFPCQRRQEQADGINEPATASVTWGDQPLSGLGDGIFAAGRGGIVTQSLRDSATTQVSARLRDFPEVTAIQIYTFGGLPPAGRYAVERTTEVVPGGEPAPNTTFSTPVDPVNQP